VLSLSRSHLVSDRKAAARGLDHLERIGLVRVERAPGLKPRATIVGRPEHQKSPG